MPARKITLGQTLAQGCAEILIYCTASTPPARCFHHSSMSTADAITRWGEDRRLDDLPLCCSKCGSRKVDVRPRF